MSEIKKRPLPHNVEGYCRSPRIAEGNPPSGALPLFGTLRIINGQPIPMVFECGATSLRTGEIKKKEIQRSCEGCPGLKK